MSHRQSKDGIECAICGKRHMMPTSRRSYKTLAGGYTNIMGVNSPIMKRIAGPHWSPIWACAEHTDFEITVWKVKTNRIVARDKNVESRGKSFRKEPELSR